MAAAKWYWATPTADWESADVFFYDSHEDRTDTAMALVNKYLATMPEEKVEFLLRYVELDLEAFRSSRRKSSKRKDEK